MAPLLVAYWRPMTLAAPFFKQRPTGIIFDFDGTLARTENAVVACAQATAKQVLGKAEFPASDVITRMGLPLAMVFCEVCNCDENTGETLALHYRKIFSQFSASITLFPRAQEYLQTLASLGYPIAIASSRGRESLAQLIDRFGFRPLLRSVVGEEDVENKKPAPDAAQFAASQAGFSSQGAWMIGDTSFDMLMGKAAGCICIGMTHGSHDQNTLQAAQADLVVHSYDPLFDHLPPKIA